MLGSFVTDVLVVVVVLGIMIFIHELGHFLAAKFFGVRVLTFSLGFGKRLLHYTWGGTDYRISALPFGGYVKMAGDDPTEVREGHPEEFLAHPRWQRFFIVVMGPTMNALLAVVLLAGLYRFHYPKPAYREQAARVGYVEPDSPAAKAGIQAGDLIDRLGGIQNPKWEDVEMKVLTGVGENLPVEVLRDSRTITATITPQARGRDRIGDVGWFPYIRAVIGPVDPGFPAAKAGLQTGDEIVGFNGQRLYCGPCLSYLLQGERGKPAALTIQRQGKEFTAQVSPVYSDIMGDKMWRIGVSFRPGAVQQLAWGEAVLASLRDNGRNCLATFDVLGKILSRRMSTRSLTGPIGIAQLSGEAYRAGIPELLMLVSFISLQLGIFNLLPIPVMDGGVILLLLIESVIRRDLSLEVKERVVQVGVVFLLLLAAFVMYNDIVKTLKPY